MVIEVNGMDYQEDTIEQLVKGYKEADGLVSCIYCAARYAVNEVFPLEGKWLNAYGMIQQHIAKTHTSPFHALLELDAKVNGLSDVQREMLSLFYEQLSDKEIVEQSSVNSISTVRQHRFKLREKERQAKMLVALMQLLKEPTHYAIHKGAKQVDERYSIEQAERDKVLATYFKHGLDGAIETIPSKEKKKLIILQHILKRFEIGKQYAEKEVNEILKTVHTDFVSLRRHLIEYGFMDRSDNGSAYWVKE